MHRLIGVGLAPLVLASLCSNGAPFYAQAGPDSAYRPDGTRLATNPVANFDRETPTDTLCIFGASDICQIPADLADHIAAMAGGRACGQSVNPSRQLCATATRNQQPARASRGHDDATLDPSRRRCTLP